MKTFRRFFYSISLGLLICGITEAKLKQTESILGKNLLYIQAAMPEINRENLPLEKYRVSLIESGETVVVVLIDKDAPTNAHAGNPGKVLGYEVELTKTTKKVIKAHYIR